MVRSGSCEPEVRPCREGEGGSAGIPPCFLFSNVLFFYFLFLQRDGCSTGFPPSKFSFFVFSEISFFLETETKIKQDMISQVIWTFLLFLFFSRILLYFWGEGRLGTHSVLPELLPFLHNLLFHLRFALWSYIANSISYLTLQNQTLANSTPKKKDKVYLLIFCHSFALTKNPCNPLFEFCKLSSTWHEEWGPPLCIHCIALHWSKKLCIIIKVLHFNWS